MISQVHVPILPSDTAGDLHDRMMPIGAQLVLESVQQIENENLQLQAQDQSNVTKAPKIHHADCEIDFSLPVIQVYDFIRGMAPYPGAWTRIDNKEVKILKCSHEASKMAIKAPGSIETDQKSQLKIHCKGGHINVLKLKMEGKRMMELMDFLNGYEIKTKLTEQKK
jgi:methionyl-tRNA formyltransferase